ncbi:MAG: hypothetical protein M1816_000444 [Peltula sp. TS41687]|nr:MAG: hypothetical protein M1816_000444 [Peltula sp. TS41687]
METEAYTSSLANLIVAHRAKLSCQDEDPSFSSSLRILDLCTGTGCIPLWLHSCLADHMKGLTIFGVDVSRQAVKLANQNLRWNVKNGNLKSSAQEEIRFVHADISKDNALWTSDLSLPDQSPRPDGHHEQREWDILISNPPYISPRSFCKDTARSVRNWEPRLALVPGNFDQGDNSSAMSPGDIFYPRLLSLAAQVKAKLVLLETADLEQATRVANLAVKSSLWDGVEIWRDWPDQGNGRTRKTPETVQLHDETVLIRGEGNGRVVLCWREL